MALNYKQKNTDVSTPSGALLDSFWTPGLRVGSLGGLGPLCVGLPSATETGSTFSTSVPKKGSVKKKN